VDRLEDHLEATVGEAALRKKAEEVTLALRVVVKMSLEDA
jgi:hypothetical protein